MALGTKLSAATTPDDKLPYRELIDSLNYVAVCARPDIAYFISKLSPYLTCYDKSHWFSAKRVLRYLKKTINSGFVFELYDNVVYGYSDSDWGNSQEDRKLWAQRHRRNVLKRIANTEHLRQNGIARSNLRMAENQALNKNNYETFKLQMEAMLIKSDKFKYVSEVAPQPEPKEAYDSWKIKGSRTNADLILCFHQGS
ncbi:hypothetical protein AVEN_155294-1 [Araneus ventricosus]|uniref:Retrovirus-related Pol polyprotein from transposon TNT 1-94 n=1 Tax=Araneus ventricosus TaxID=182803 RepID=A0A4Y2D9P0_ARAVE|nr:hypothetical protein AVEN_155294-1 [Araneus ventricosus]